MLLTLIFAAAVSGAICFVAQPLARALGVMDIPDGRRKLHERPTPEVGGIAIGIPTIMVLSFLAVTTPFTPLFASIALGTAGCLILGFLDDRQHVRPLYRLLASVAVVAVAVWMTPAQQVGFFRFSFLDVALFPTPWLAAGFTVLCVVGLQNAVNMADGKNGLAVGLLLTWALLLLGYAPPHLLPALVAVIAALAVVFAFNINGTVFLGDAGTYGVSVTVALLALHTYSVSFPELHADVVALWFLVPVADALRLMVARVIAGHSPFSPDRRHLHHVLQAAFPAWPSGARLGLYLGMVALPGVLAIPFADLTLLWAALALVAYAAVLVARAPQARLNQQTLASRPQG